VSEVTFADGSPESGEPARTDHGVVPPDRLDAFSTFIAETLLPELRTRPGYRSLTIRIERDTGDVRVISTWSDANARRAAADAFLPVLRHAAEFDLRPIAIEEP
jgi:hypothetical protein